jgi:hypothetical protein
MEELVVRLWRPVWNTFSLKTYSRIWDLSSDGRARKLADWWLEDGIAVYGFHKRFRLSTFYPFTGKYDR